MHSLEKWVRKNTGKMSEKELYRSYLPRNRGTRWHSWLSHCAEGRKVVGSIADGVIDIIFQAALWPLTEMSTRNIFWGVKTAGA